MSEQALLNFAQRTAKLNMVAGNARTGNWADIRRQFNILASEFAELAAAIDRQDIDQVRDGTADLTVVGGGLGFIAGFDANDDFNDVMDSLFTRFDVNIENAELTLEKYRNRGVPCHTRRTEVDGVTYYATIVSEDCVDQTNGERLKKGKFLKSVFYSTPKLREMDEEFTVSLLLSAGEVGDKAVDAAIRLLTDKRDYTKD